MSPISERKIAIIYSYIPEWNSNSKPSHLYLNIFPLRHSCRIILIVSKYVYYIILRPVTMYDCKSDWLWVRSPLEEMKYLLTFIFSLWCRGKAQRWVPPLKTQCLGRSGKWRTECLNIPIWPTLLCAGYSVKLKIYIVTYVTYVRYVRYIYSLRNAQQLIFMTWKQKNPWSIFQF